MSKNFIKVREVEGLPSFLLDLTAIPEDVSFPPRPAISDLYLGPVFFGQCNENHPPLHSVNFSTFRHIEKTYHAKENINDLFLPKTATAKPVKVSKPVRFKPTFKRKQTYSDPYTHKCPGTRRVFVPEVKPPVIDFGESTSVIEGETVLEIPLYRLTKVSSGTTAPEFELVNFSDIQEKKRMYMPYKERISHIHFPKQFATVTVVGPTIPAAITVTKLATKRKTQSVEDLLNTQKVIKGPKEETNEEKTDEVKEEPEDNFSADEEDSVIFSSEGSIDNERNLEIQIIDEEDEESLREASSEQLTEKMKEATEELNDEETVESDGEFSAEDVKAAETDASEMIEKTEENEEPLEENADEEAGEPTLV